MRAESRKTLRKRRIRQVSCNWGFTLVSTHAGNVFSWGDNKSGQLGHGDTRHRYVPTLIDALVNESKRALRISQVACGSRHGAAIGATGRVYTWGWNRHGQLGLGDTHDRLVPSAVTRLSKRTIKQIACGWRYTVALSSLNEIWAWGHAGCVRLSVQKEAPAISDQDVDRTQFEVLVPTEVPVNLASSRIPLRLYTSFSHTRSCTGLMFQQRAASIDVMSAPLLVHASRSMVQAEADRMVHASGDLAIATGTGVREDISPASPPSPFTSPVDRRAFSNMSIEVAPLNGNSTPFNGKHGRKASAATEALSAKLDPMTLRTMDKKQLRILIEELTENARHHGILGGITSAQNRTPIHREGARETGISRGRFVDYKTRAEHEATFLHRGQGTTPIHRMQEKAWDNQFASKRMRGRSGSDYATSPTYKSESYARTDMLRIQGGQDDEDAPEGGEFGPTSEEELPAARRRLGERHSSVVLRNQRIRGVRVSATPENVAAQAEKLKIEAKKSWRAQREGNLDQNDIAGLFSSDLVIQCSEENVADGTRVEKYVPSEDPVSDSLSIYRKQMKLMEEEDAMRKHSESQISSQVVAEQLQGPQWTGRRQSRIERKRREIEREYAMDAPRPSRQQQSASMHVDALRSRSSGHLPHAREKSATVGFGGDTGSISDVLARIQAQAAEDVAKLWREEDRSLDVYDASLNPPPPSRARVGSAADLASSIRKADKRGGAVQTPSLTRLLARARSVTSESSGR